MTYQSLDTSSLPASGEVTPGAALLRGGRPAPVWCCAGSGLLPLSWPSGRSVRPGLDQSDGLPAA